MEIYIVYSYNYIGFHATNSYTRGEISYKNLSLLSEISIIDKLEKYM